MHRYAASVLLIVSMTLSGVVHTASPVEVLRTLERSVSDPQVSREEKIAVLQEHQAPSLQLFTGEQVVGREAFRPYIARFLSALPDLRIRFFVIDTQADALTTIETVTGTHTGSELLGHPARGRAVAFTLLHTMRFEQGRISRQWSSGDYSLVERQLLGSLPAETAAELDQRIVRTDAAAGTCDVPTRGHDPERSWPRLLTALRDERSEEKTLQELMQPTYRLTLSNGIALDAAQAARWLRHYESLFDDADLSDLSLIYSNGATAVRYGKRRGRYANPNGLLGLPVQRIAREVVITENHIYSICDDRLHRHYLHFDALELQRQLAAAPDAKRP